MIEDSIEAFARHVEGLVSFDEAIRGVSLERAEAILDRIAHTDFEEGSLDD